jgi:NADH:ubiquinone oxidoreductase subunit F (NADH-binding)
VTTLRLLRGIRSDGRALSLDEHLHRHGPLPARPQARELLELVEASGLRGRGGARFPAAAKLRAVAARRGGKVVVANGTEGEPASGKDKVLLRYVPQLVLDGAVLAAATVGSTEVIVAVSEGAAAERASVEAALRERRHAGMDAGVRLRLVPVPDRFVAGEETALVSVLGGGAPLPTTKPPRPFERGVGGAPTLVQNVETLAHVALLARRGAAWFREVGTHDDPGTVLVTLSGAVARPGVYEIALGTPLRELVDEAGGTTGPPRAVLAGGYFGSWLDAATALSCPLDGESLAAAGAALGAGAIVVMPQGGCAVTEVARVGRWLADESAGQCGPCVHGLAAVAGMLESVARRDSSDGDLRLRGWIEQIRGRGACRHPDGAAAFVASALDVFSEELALHLRGEPCGGRDLGILPLPGLRARRAA